MKRYIKCLILLLFISAGCEDVIVKKELDAVDNEDMWNDADLATLYLNNLYNLAIPGFAGTANTDISDESFGAGPGRMMYGLLSSSASYGNFSVVTYGHIRKINILLDEIDKGSISDEEKDLIKGQALFLRGWMYWELVKFYGGVPMIMIPQDPNLGEGLFSERDPAAECIALIIEDLNSAIETLPASWSEAEYGRITKSAAAALKGRILLFYASPQFNPDNSADRWIAAYEANKKAKEIALANGHGLYPDFENIFLEEGNEEAIMVTVYNNIKSHGYENSVRPASVNNSGTTSGNPVWELVKAFPMKDGRPIEEHPEYEPQVYWKHRDPRFYATIAYNSDEWIFEERSSSRQWTYIFNDQEGENFNSRTGFYLRKNVDESIPKDESPRTPTDWIEIRYAEVLLNLAESANEAGHIEEAYIELKAIRERAGIEAGINGLYGLDAGMSVEEMRKAIMLERKIELAFENKRHWDLRRRNLFTKELNGTRRTGIQTQLDTAYIKTLTGLYGNAAFAHFETEMRDTIDWENPDNYDLYFNTEFGVNLDDMNINYLQPKYNFYYIPQDVLDKDPKLKQTIHWSAGDSFDPLNP